MRLLLLIVISACGLRTVAEEVPVKKFVPTAQTKIVPPNAKLEIVYNDGEFTEGPTPNGQREIVFSDIGNRILKYSPQTGQTSVFREPSGRTNGLMFDPNGRLIACHGANTGGERRISVTEKDGSVKTLADSYQGKRFNSPNDLVITKSGRIFFTDPRYTGDEPRELDFEGVFCIETDGTVKVATKEIEKPNGIVLSLDERTAFVADNNNTESGNRHLVSFQIQPDGSFINKKVLWNFGPQQRGIDGMTTDQQGNIFATAGKDEKSGVYVFSPTAEPLAFIPTPGPPTNCVFAGEKRQTLYITCQGPEPRDIAQERKYALVRIKLNNTGYHVFPPRW